MVDAPALSGLLDRANNVFMLAGGLGRAFHEEHQQGMIDAAAWNRHAPTFNEFCHALLDLREPIQNPPDGFAPVAEQLKEAARIARAIRRVKGRAFVDYLEFFPQMNSVAEAGRQAVKQLTKAKRINDPFPFVGEAAEGGSADQEFTQLGDFPLTQEGHLLFIERIRDEVRNAAIAKLSRDYSNATIDKMIGGIKWVEARRRLTALTGLPADVRDQVDRVLRREVAVGTIEQIDELLKPAVWELRDELEDSGDTGPANKIVVVETAGDLWKALEEGYKPGIQASAISFRPQAGVNLSQPTFPKPADQLKWDILDRALALCDAEGGDRAEAMRKLIARLALVKGADRRQIINIPLAEFVAAAGVDTPDERPTPDDPRQQAELAEVAPMTKKPKRSTERGEARAKLIAALTEYHNYAEDSCLNLEPVGNNELARKADVDPSTASAFFNKEFSKREKGGHANYKVICRNAGRLAESLKALNGEFSPHDLYGRRPPGENDHDNGE